MALLTESWMMYILLFIVTLLCMFYWYLSRNANYFKERGIPYLRPIPIIGQLEVFTETQYDLTNMLYKCFPNERYFGYFQATTPTLVVKDPDLIQRIIVKDFAHFHDRGFPSVESDKLSRNLFNLKGLHWRILRQKLIPTFTTGKLKQMFDQLNKCGDNLLKDVEKVSKSGEAVDARAFTFPYPTEVIGSAAFGLDFHKNSPQAIEFNEKIGDIFSMSLRQKIVLFITLLIPRIVNMMKIPVFPEHMSSYFNNLTRATKEYRKNNNLKRNDYFQLLLSLQEAEESGKSISVLSTGVENSEEDAVIIDQLDYVPKIPLTDIDSKLFTDDCITAQSFVFLTAGTESVSTTLSFALYHIAKDPDVQKRLTGEVEMAIEKHKGWTYQTIKDMEFLDQVIQETQRMYPIVPLTMRQCTIPYAIPNSNVVLEKGAIVAIPVGGLQMDPKYHPSPEIFNPDRFADNNHKPNPAFMPFGDGPRICIAMRFAILEMKLCLAKILAGYSIEVNSKTEEPFTFDKNFFFPRTVGGIWINFKKRTQKSTTN